MTRNNAAAATEPSPKSEVVHAAETVERTTGRTMESIEAALQAKLSAESIKERSKGGVKLSYIEAWHAIAEANRIFGHNGWERETVYCKEVCRYERQGNSKTLWVVGYEAKVKVTAMGITREGTGHGSGQQSELYDAIESAAKEAESDAMKRAMMTFCNPFGMALYDKTKENVEGVSVFKNASLRNTFFNNLVASWESCESVKALAERKALDDAKLKEMSEGSEHDQLAYEELKKRYSQLYKALQEAERLNRAADKGNFDGVIDD